MKKVIFLALFSLSFCLKAQEKCSIFIVGTNYAIDFSNPNYSLKAEWVKDKIMIQIKVPNKYVPGAFDYATVAVAGSHEGVYPVGFDTEKGTGLYPSSVGATWFDAKGTKRQLGSSNATKTVGRIAIRTKNANTISGNFAININGEVIEGGFTNLAINNLPKS